VTESDNRDTGDDDGADDHDEDANTSVAEERDPVVTRCAHLMQSHPGQSALDLNKLSEQVRQQQPRGKIWVSRETVLQVASWSEHSVSGNRTYYSDSEGECEVHAQENVHDTTRIQQLAWRARHK
jgi:hypothetical protein